MEKVTAEVLTGASGERRDVGHSGGRAARRRLSWFLACADAEPKAKMLVAVDLTNKMARTAWALIAGGGAYAIPERG
ncbi:hypothetical protein LH464_08930 [Neorhizobium sp. T786]|uniref:hypothetical protein n=1 Tax=Pseudorhizobium xiangyangii TaxID=2883104 RepID=UPI001CFFD699|nr:hypothetical protein [Neorhizobium xiangyangii]MCB5202602.1 hypothetical protein [Neorhizobium xiangyangii]